MSDLENGDAFTVLVVCTGNICRSPVAEAILRDRLQAAVPRSAPVVVVSAGTGCQPGTAIDGRAALTLERLGIPVGLPLAQQLTAELVRSADLVLGASREHRAAAVRLAPAVSARAFTMREFDRLLADLGPAVDPPASPLARGRALVRAAAQHRGVSLPDKPEDDDIPDPYRRSNSSYDASMAVLVEALHRPVARLIAALELSNP